MRCPVCRAENSEGPNCRRCRADLSLLFALEEQRSFLLEKAGEMARLGYWSEVERLAQEAHDLRADYDSQQVLAVGQLMQHKFAAAWLTHRTCPSET